MPTKKETDLALSKAFDGGQAAQAGGFPAEGNPFEEGTDERAEWQRGFEAELAEKWTQPARRITQEITN
jgi:hypothetical protein